jgi:hypothetical protein
MDGAAVKELATRFRGPAEIGGFIVRPNDWVVDDPAALVKAGPSATVLDVWSLGALRDYLKSNRDSLPLEKLIVHVVSPSIVTVSGPLVERSRTRESYIKAHAQDLTKGFLGVFMSLEHFIIGLQVRFTPTDDTRRLLSLLSNVKHETVKTALDDGVTQVVQARAGVALVQDVAIPNPVELCPYRTFRDVIQPSSPFVLRVNQGKPNGLPEVGLFEADGGIWELTATQRVQSWLTAELPATVAVLA